MAAAGLNSPQKLRILVAELSELTGYSRSACLRFIRQMGARHRFRYRRWPASGRQYRVAESARPMRCSKASVDAPPRRMDLRSGRLRDRFSLQEMEKLLHLRKSDLELWIRNGWLKATTVKTENAERTVIFLEDLRKFCHAHREKIVKAPSEEERQAFIDENLFPPQQPG
jgi:hypothetical protein